MKNRIMLTIVFTAVLLASFSSLAEQPYLDANRIAYAGKTLRAFNATSMQKLLNAYRYISVVDYNNCRSSISGLRVECLLSYAHKNCEAIRNTQSRENCELYSDVIVVNKLSERVFINRTERYRISKIAGYDFRTAFRQRLQQKYARIVTQFSLSEAANCDASDIDCLAKGLDQFCLDYTNSQSLSWQYCMSASLWFIGTSKPN